MTSTLHLQGFSAGTLVGYQTTGNSAAHWQQGSPLNVAADGSFTLSIPAQSVTTFTGAKN